MANNIEAKPTNRPPANPLIQRGFATFSKIRKNEANWTNKPVIIIF